ncbi:hypothetical protein PsYK624_027040 [Phanerochaete sordida]|uniref:Uncharacterized protein n=1 Tax=Phanerochaete sordida TaxID=48140 RepID=A0A9P3G2D9_9APHY|nr:hypothetical protein PsYK624_027040 [Phanerochaete sordida]
MSKSSRPNGQKDLDPIPANVAKDLSAEKLMKLTFRMMMNSGDFVDTKFYAYSRRKATGVVYAPKPIFANSFILRARSPQYFEPSLQGQYNGYSVVGPLNAPYPDNFPAEDDGHGFESDSDIDDDEDEEEAEKALPHKGDSSKLPKPETQAKPDDNEDSADATPVTGNEGRIRLVPTFAYATYRSDREIPPIP